MDSVTLVSPSRERGGLLIEHAVIDNSICLGLSRVARNYGEIIRRNMKKPSRQGRKVFYGTKETRKLEDEIIFYSRGRGVAGRGADKKRRKAPLKNIILSIFLSPHPLKIEVSPFGHRRYSCRPSLRSLLKK